MTTPRQHDAIEAAREAARERMVAAALRGGIAPPEPPVTSLGEPGFYDDPPELETVKLDGPAAGRSPAEEDTWRQVYMAPEAVLRREEEREALIVLDELRVQKLEADAIEEPRLSHEPVRTSVRDSLFWQARG